MELQDFYSGVIQPKDQTFHQWKYGCQNYGPIKNECCITMFRRFDSRKSTTTKATAKTYAAEKLSTHQLGKHGRCSLSTIFFLDNCPPIVSTVATDRLGDQLKKTIPMTKSGFSFLQVRTMKYEIHVIHGRHPRKDMFARIFWATPRP